MNGCDMGRTCRRIDRCFREWRKCTEPLGRSCARRWCRWRERRNGRGRPVPNASIALSDHAAANHRPIHAYPTLRYFSLIHFLFIDFFPHKLLLIYCCLLKKKWTESLFTWLNAIKGNNLIELNKTCARRTISSSSIPDVSDLQQVSIPIWTQRKITKKIKSRDESNPSMKYANSFLWISSSRCSRSISSEPHWNHWNLSATLNALVLFQLSTYCSLVNMNECNDSWSSRFFFNFCFWIEIGHNWMQWQFTRKQVLTGYHLDGTHVNEWMNEWMRPPVALRAGS